MILQTKRNNIVWSQNKPSDDVDTKLAPSFVDDIWPVFSWGVRVDKGSLQIPIRLCCMVPQGGLLPPSYTDSTLVAHWKHQRYLRADSRFASSQWETALLCNDVSHWLGTSLESALYLTGPKPLTEAEITKSQICEIEKKFRELHLYSCGDTQAYI